jgi:DNA-binding transcriptional regulator YdaS (Cro superfamily)
LHSVRVHTGTHAQDLTQTLSTRAVTYGNHIFLGSGERPSDLRVMAHEAAHVVQQRAAPALQPFSSSHENAYESEAEQASAAVLHGESFSVHEHTSGPRMQGFLGIDIPNPLNWLADKANIIPGFRMFTIILGMNPINMSPVARSAANILRALIEFLPGGGLITQALDNSGVFEKAGAFVEKQLASLGMAGSAIKAAVTAFISSLSVSDILHLGDVWERAKRIFSEPIDRIISFGKGLVTGIIQLIKDAILKPIAKLAEGTNGYALLKAVMGRDPITGDPVPQTAEAIIEPFMKLIGQEEIWENMKKSNAIGRAFAWFKGALSGLMSFVTQIPGLFVAAFRSLEIMDIVLVPRAFAKLVGVFGSFLGKFISWAGSTIWNLLEIIFDVVSPGALGYIKKTGSALKSIFRNPLPFVGNLVRAAKLGFTNFASNFGTHLKTGLIDWLTGSLPGVYIPRAFTLSEIVKFVLSVLGISWANLRQKLVRATSETVVRAMEVGFDIVKTLVTQGPAAAWEQIKDQLANLKDQVINGIIEMVVGMIVTKAVPKLVAMFIPGAGFISAIISIYDTVMVFVNKISRIIQVVTGFINSIVAIAAGNIGAAASKVESVLAGLLALAINFLAGFAGLGRVADKVMVVINKIRAPIDRAMDALVTWIVAAARRLGRFVAQAGVPQDPNERLRLAANAAVAAARRLTGRVTSAILQPVLGAIKLRYGLSELVPFERGGKWWVRATANPTLERNLDIVTVAPGTPAAAPSTLQPMTAVPISFRCNTLKYIHSVYDGQLQGQAAGLNALSATDWEQNIATYATAGRGSSAEQEAARQVLRQDLKNKGKTPAEIEAELELMAALHEPDMVAGGRNWVTKLGSRYINSSIGSQWRTKWTIIRDAVTALGADKPNRKINVVLTTVDFTP